VRPPHLRNRSLWLAPVLALSGGCIAPPARVESLAPVPVATGPVVTGPVVTGPVATGVVYVIDGAGGYQTAPRSVAAAVADAHLPLEVRSFHWTHDRGLGLADEVDVAHSRDQGRRLAEEVVRFHAAHPGVPVYLVAYSAGCAVALSAAESAPPDGLERVILLAPSVSDGYDLRAALAGSRSGIDVFVSARDRFWLGVGTGVVGTSDGRRQAAAGRVGFEPPVDPLVGRLRQHPWDPAVVWTGNTGGHTGTLQATYLRAYVLPLLSSQAGN
jgi:hypothetical protein